MDQFRLSPLRCGQGSNKQKISSRWWDFVYTFYKAIVSCQRVGFFLIGGAINVVTRLFTALWKPLGHEITGSRNNCSHQRSALKITLSEQSLPVFVWGPVRALNPAPWQFPFNIVAVLPRQKIFWSREVWNYSFGYNPIPTYHKKPAAWSVVVRERLEVARPTLIPVPPIRWISCFTMMYKNTIYRCWIYCL